METMRTQDYLKFRDKLFPASGFQSAQLREIEILLGLDDADRIAFGNEASYREALRAADGGSSPALERVERRAADRPTLKDAVYDWLQRTPIDASSPGAADDDAIVGRFVERFLAQMAAGRDRWLQHRLGSQALTAEDRSRLERRYQAELDSAAGYLRADDIADARRSSTRRLRAAILFIESNRQLPLLSWPGEIIDGLVAAEQSMLIFRQRHARMVERVIGRRLGTGGSDGVDYLDRTALSYRVFKEIWAARTMLLEADRTPPIDNADYYGLRSS
jgi:tryptophan 2,3-dioxygenase